MEQQVTFDNLTIEEYVHSSRVLSAGLSRNGPDESAYISMIRDISSIPLIMMSLEKDNRAAITALELNVSLIQNVLVVYTPAHLGTPLVNYANTLQPYGTFDLIEKIIADLAQYEHLDLPIFAQLLSADKYIIDSNDMPHVQFWIDDLTIFNETSSEDLGNVKNEKISQLLDSAFSVDFTPKQLIQLSEDVQNGRYKSCLEILDALSLARQAYYDSDSERKGEVIIRSVWKRMQKSMLIIVILLLALIYGLYWFFYSRTEVSTTVYKVRIGDVAFVAEPETGQNTIESSTYILMFPEEPKEPVPNEAQPQSDTTQPDASQKSENIIIRPGQNLFRISFEYYGDGNYYRQLAEYNGIPNPDLIPVGLSLEIPPLEVLLESTE